VAQISGSGKNRIMIDGPKNGSDTPSQVAVWNSPSSQLVKQDVKLDYVITNRQQE
jgi:hypothetical protein